MKSLIRNFNTKKIEVFLVVFAAMILSLVSGLMVVRGQVTYVIFGVLIFVAVIFTFSKPRFTIMMILIGSFSFEFLVRQKFLPSTAQWGVDGLILLLFSRLVFEKSRLTGFFSRSPVFLGLIFWATFMILSGIANSIPILQLVVGMRTYIRFILLYFCILEFAMDMKFFSSAIKLIGFLIIIQIPIQVFQKIQYSNVDLIGGSIGGTGLVSLIETAGFAGLMAYGLLKRKLNIILLGFLLLIGPALATARAFIFIIPLVTGYVLLRFSSYVKRIFWLVPLIFFVVGILLTNWAYLQGQSAYRGASAVDVLTNPSAILDELWLDPQEGSSGSSVGRLRGLQLSWERIQNSIPTFFLGFGTSSAQGSRFASLQSDMFNDISLGGGRASQLAISISEWGILGTGIYIFILLRLWWQSEKYFRLEKDLFWKSVAFGHATFVLMVIVLAFYTNSWLATTLGVLTWFLAAVLHRRQVMLKTEYHTETTQRSRNLETEHIK